MLTVGVIQKNPPLYTCAADIKIISFWVLKPAAAAV